MPNLWYFPIEAYDSRYTRQLCQHWMPDAFQRLPNGWTWQSIQGVQPTQPVINVGQVLDATGRGRYALTQTAAFLDEIEARHVSDGDVLYLQDFWTPGLEAIAYALHLYHLTVRVYSTVWAQSVDEYDFTYPMRRWLRPLELGYDALHAGLFVGSGIHKEQLQQAGFTAPIYVVGLPIDSDEVSSHMPSVTKQPQVIYCSRLDAEKNPAFMLQTAECFLDENPHWTWKVTTSAPEFRSNKPSVLTDALALQARQPRFQLCAGLSKNAYYAELAASAIQFNSSLQDYVSWTLLEACLAGCDIVYPDFRSFPECVPADRRYVTWEVDSALRVLASAQQTPRQHRSIPQRCHLGRQLEVSIMTDPAWTRRDNFNIWKMVV